MNNLDRMKHTKRRIDEWVYWAFSFHLSSCCFMLHSPLDNEYLSIFLKVINYSSASWSPVLTWPLLTEKYILSCHLFLPIMVVVRQFPAASSLTVLNPGEYTARSGADILRISVKLIENWSFFLGMRLLQSTLTGFVSKENMSIHYNPIQEWWCGLDAGLYTPYFHNAGLKWDR